jgi:large subunit ribosomal protein L3
MSSAFDGAGTTVPVTLLMPMDCFVTEIKRPAKHGYSALQIAYSETRDKKVNKPHRGVLKKAGVEQALRYFYEIRLDEADLEGFELGQRIHPGDFLKTWDQVHVTGTAKGKGFAGAVKRWGFRGQQRTHGDPDNRRPMSANATDPARVFKGKKGPGRMGNWQVTLRGSTVFDFDSNLNLLALTGSVPGPNGGIVFVDVQTTVEPVEVAVAEEQGE